MEGEFATPVNENARTIFSRLMTTYLAEQLGNEDPHQVRVQPTTFQVVLRDRNNNRVSFSVAEIANQ